MASRDDAMRTSPQAAPQVRAGERDGGPVAGLVDALDCWSREREVLRFTAEGLRAKEIADKLGVIDRYQFIFGKPISVVPWKPLSGDKLRYETQNALNGSTRFIVGDHFEIGLNLTIALDSVATFASKIAHFTV